MYLDKDAFFKFIETYFEGNQSKCARELNVWRTTVWRVLTERSDAGKKLMSSLVQYCNKNKLDYRDIIFFK